MSNNKLSLTNRYLIGHEHFINEDYDADDLLIQLDYHDETRKRLIKRNKKGTHKLFGILKTPGKFRMNPRFSMICNVLYVHAYSKFSMSF